MKLQKALKGLKRLKYRELVALWEANQKAMNEYVAQKTERDKAGD